MIDIVIPWVDGSDSQWVQKKNRYDTQSKSFSNSDARYRDWGLIRYLFRGIEKNMPWVNKVHFITAGHLPSWLNEECAMLNIVEHHSFFQDSKDLPTFSSRPIEMNMSRIEGLSEKFIYFNDDTLILRSVQPCRFFENNLPVDFLIQSIPRRGWLYRKFRSNNAFSWAVANCVDEINAHFNKRELLSSNKEAFYSRSYGISSRIFNQVANLLLREKFPHFVAHHQPQPYLKSIHEEARKKCHHIVQATSGSRFRANNDVNQYLFRFWQLAKGAFYPKQYYDYKYYRIEDKTSTLQCVLSIEQFSFVCINDSVPDNINDEVYEMIKALLEIKLSEIFPEKSNFER